MIICNLSKIEYDKGSYVVLEEIGTENIGIVSQHEDPSGAVDQALKTASETGHKVAVVRLSGFYISDKDAD